LRLSRGLGIAVLALLVMGFGVAKGEGEAEFVSFTLAEGGFVSSWLLLGPFVNAPEGFTEHGPACKGYYEDLLAEYGGEEKIQPYEGMECGGRVWKFYLSNTPIVDFDAIFKPNDNVVAYAACWIFVPEERDVLLKVGSDDGVRIWVGDVLVHDNHSARPVRIDEDTVPVRLKAGMNRVLVKVDEGVLGWGFVLRVLDRDGKVMKDVRVYLPIAEGEKEAAKAFGDYLGALFKDKVLHEGEDVVLHFSKCAIPCLEGKYYVIAQLKHEDKIIAKMWVPMGCRDVRVWNVGWDYGSGDYKLHLALADSRGNIFGEDEVEFMLINERKDPPVRLQVW